ncbi:SOUL family heme-binding protein [Agitococcus lubricus]|uniref:SOUL heme-binding protein n=1 Tax=Agitococcus lubricus TaxID=1077255 RepID=A0A2T5J2S1_9GAMM|nr:heme-binding protein [Agitococcus lubricus]PTQ90712.1 SOUL heme-binding protein [Agitococcus lubricus]
MMSLYLRQLTLVLFLTLLGKQALAIEEAKYTVLKKEGALELRQYAPHIVAETVVESDFEEAGNKAFRRLFNYISGHNEARQDIAMTTPVSQAAKGEKIAMTVPVGQQPSGNNWVVSFTMPASYTLDTLPKPKDSQVILRQVPEHYVAAIRYSGFWSQKSYNHHKQQLEAWIKQQSVKTTGEAIWARYNAPFTPWFFRRNEILMPVEQ